MGVYRVSPGDATATDALREFACLHLWVLWKLLERGGKPTKVPFSPIDQRNAAANDPATWGTRTEAERLVADYSGVGIMLAPLDEGRHLGGIDLDACIDDEGNVAPWAREIVELTDSYAEVSPSGHGLKIYFIHDPRETLIEGLRWKSAVRRPSPNGSKEPGIEFYLAKRYFATTNQTFEHYDTVRHVELNTLREVQAKMSVFAGKPEASTYQPRHRDDEQQRILDAIGRMANRNLHWNEWNRIGMAIYAATGGSAQGYAAFLGWSAKSAKYDPAACEERWQHWRNSPPDQLTAGTIFFEAGPNPAAKREKNTQAKSNSTGDANVDTIEAITWGEPEPLHLDTERHPYPVHALPDLTRQAVEEVEVFVQCPVEMVAASALSALSIAAQPLIDIRRSSGLQGPTSLYYLTVANSGERKTSSDRHFMRAIYDYEKKMLEEGKSKEADFAAELAVWEAQKEGANAKLNVAAKEKKPLDAQQADLASLEKGKPKPPRIPRLIYADVTQEKLLRNLATKWPAAAIVSNEAATVFGAHAMGKDTVMRTLGALNVLWDGGVLSVDRVAGDSFTVRGARLSINLQVQAAVLSDFMVSNKGLARGSGFLSRFLFAAPETRQGTRMFREPPAAWPALDDYNARITELLEIKTPLNDDGSLSPAVLEFDREAKGTWVALHDLIEKELAPNGEFVDVRDVAAKAAENIARLAALFHVLDAQNGFGKIGPKTVQAAGLVVVWHLYEALRFLGLLSSPPELAQMAALDLWICDHCRREGVTTVSTRTVQQFGPVRDREVLDKALAELTERGRVKLITEGKKRLIAVNPALLTPPPVASVANVAVAEGAP
jgi:putative DNA primase/helicase